MSPDLFIQKRKDQRKQKRGLRKSQTKTNHAHPPTTPNGIPTAPSSLQQHKQQEHHRRGKRKGKTFLETEKRTESKISKKSKSGYDQYAYFDSETASALRREDAEIAALEAKLGLADSKEKKKLFKEYATQEGYGDDFGEFLDGLDDMVERVKSNRHSELPSAAGHVPDEDDLDDSTSESSDEDSMESERFDNERDNKILDGSQSDNDEMVPMAEPASNDSTDDDSNDDSSDSKDSLSEGSGTDIQTKDTYRPAEGEDIYGNKVDRTNDSSKSSKYVPPHMRGQQNVSDNKEAMAAIRRSLNNALNRLSHDTLLTVTQSIAKLYASHPTGIVNNCIWENLNNVCIVRAYLMTGLTPVYAAAMVGIHIQKGDKANLAEHIIEMIVTNFDKALKSERQSENIGNNDKNQDELSNPPEKKVINLVLFLCYLYNYDVVHCNLIYDVIRNLINSFEEVDIELLLIILSHSGRSLRSDDPSALKAIVLDVQKKAYEKNDTVENSSRVSYLVSAVVDLKNNKRRKQDIVFGEKTAQLRKLIGRIKSVVAANTGNGRSSDSSLRLRLKDILEAEGKGRWWRVGAAWEGNKHGEVKTTESTSSASDIAEATEDQEKQNQLLRLAAKCRMNTDTRRSVFCIMMGSADFEDAFEKLVRAGLLKNKAERETARVLMENCGNEKTYNKFYAHLAKRICEYQTQSRFTFQLAYWDSFKQLEDMKPRKAANLAKLLFALIVEHRLLKLNVLKGIDMTSPEDLSESGMIFLTIFFTKLMEHFDDSSDLKSFFDLGLNNQRQETVQSSDSGNIEETEALYASLTMFFVQVLKSSPKNKKRSKFRTNLKAAIKACDADNFFI